NLHGKIDDPAWGPLAIAGNVDPTTKAVSLTLSHQGLGLDMPKLRKLPFLPPKLWQKLELEGTTVPLRLTLHTASTAPRVRYRVEFGGLRVRLPQPDRPAFTVTPVHGVMEGTEDGFRLTGMVDDPSWGKWTASARLD